MTESSKQRPPRDIFIFDNGETPFQAYHTLDEACEDHSPGNIERFIEASYAKELEAEVERLKKDFSSRKLNFHATIFDKNCQIKDKDTTIASLTEKLAVAVAALDGLQKYVAYNGDDWVRLEASEALASIRGENG